MHESDESEPRPSGEAPGAPEPAVGGHGVRHLLAVLAADGFDAGLVRRAAGLGGRPIDDPEARISFRSASAAWTAAVRLTGDEALGLHAAERLDRGALGALEYAIRHSATVGTALRQLVRYGRLVHDLASFGLAQDGERIRLTLGVPGSPPPVTQAAQFFLAAPLAVLRDCVADDLAPREAHFAHADPGSPATGEYPRVLRAPVLFSQPDRALVFDARQLDVPLVEADPILGGILDAHLRRALEALPPVPDASFCSRVRRVLAETLSSGEPAAHVVAGRLGVGVRTLNRRLTAEGASLRGLRDTLRRELAESHLTERRLPIPQVAFLLGFSEASAFHRWFRRVSGTTPSAFRRARTLRASRASPASELPSS